MTDLAHLPVDRNSNPFGQRAAVVCITCGRWDQIVYRASRFVCRPCAGMPSQVKVVASAR